MNGPEHYRQAEKLIDDAHTMQSENGPGCGSEEVLAEAQVHATLALAAATALLGPVASRGYGDRDLNTWREAAGRKA